MRLFGYRSLDGTIGLLWALSFFATSSAAILGRRQEASVCAASEQKCFVPGASQFCCPKTMKCGSLENSCTQISSSAEFPTSSRTVARTKSIGISSPSQSATSFPSSRASGTTSPTATARTAAATLGQDKPVKPPIAIIAIAASGGAILIITLVSYFCYRKRKQGRPLLAAYEDPKRKPSESVILGSGEKPLSLRTLSPPPPPERATMSDGALVMSLKPADLKEIGQAPPVEVERPAEINGAGIIVCTPCEKPAKAEKQICTEAEKHLPPPIGLHPAFPKSPKSLEPRPYDLYSPESPGFIQMVPQESAGPLDDGGHTGGNGDGASYPQEPPFPRTPPPRNSPSTPQGYSQDIFQEYFQEFQEDMQGEYIGESLRTWNQQGEYIDEPPRTWNQQAEFPAPGRPLTNELRDSYADTADIYASYAPSGSPQVHCPSPTYPRDSSLQQSLETPVRSPCTPPPPSPLRGHWSQLPAPRQLTPPQRPRTLPPVTAHMMPQALQPQFRLSVTTTPPPPSTPPQPKTASPCRPPRGPDVYLPDEMVTYFPQMIMPHAL